MSGPDGLPAYIIVDRVSCFWYQCLIDLIELYENVNILTSGKIQKFVLFSNQVIETTKKNYRSVALIPNFAKVFECIVVKEFELKFRKGRKERNRTKRTNKDEK